MEKSCKKFLTTREALKKSAKYCALQERCQDEMRHKLHEWIVFGEEAEAVIAELISLGFLNEERFAKAFAGGRFRMKKWGRNKIRAELKKRKISEYCINKGLQEIQEADYIRVLKEIIRKKSMEIREKNHFRRMNRVAAFALQKGYESELVWDIVRESYLK